ncbi:hypothetical protein QTP88_008663 [Uroleucon formosanum]
MVNRFSNLKRRENPGNASVTPVPKARSDSRETKISAALKEKPDTENPCKQITIQFKLYQKNMEHQSVSYKYVNDDDDDDNDDDDDDDDNDDGDDIVESEGKTSSSRLEDDKSDVRRVVGQMDDPGPRLSPDINCYYYTERRYETEFTWETEARRSVFSVTDSKTR